MRDAYDCFVDEEHRLQKMLARLPKCCRCNEPIQDEYGYDVDGDWFCEDCMKREFRKRIED